MIPFVVVAIGTVLAVEIALRSPLLRALRRLKVLSRKAGSVVLSQRISDHWKERVLPAYAGRIMSASLGMFLWLVAVAAPLVASVALVFGSLAEGSAFLLRPVPLVLVTVVGIAWIAGRTRFAA